MTMNYMVRLRLFVLLTVVAVSVLPSSARAQAPQALLDSLRRDFEEIVDFKAKGLTEITPTYFVIGGNWNANELSSERVEFAKIYMVTTQRGIFFQPGKKDYVRVTGQWYKIGWASCIPGEGCSGVARQLSFEAGLAIRANASLERVQWFMERLKSAARYNGANPRELDQYTSASSDPQCSTFGRRITHLMTAIHDHTEDADEQSENMYMHQTEMQRNACVDPKNDSEDLQRQKIQYFTQRFDRFLKDSYERGMLETAILTTNYEFIEDAVKWGIDMNRVRDRTTPLDFVLSEREGTLTSPIGYMSDSVAHANARFDELKGYDVIYHNLRNAGAKHYRELSPGRELPLVDATGTWHGTVSSTEARIPSHFDFDLTVRSNDGVWSGEFSAPSLGMRNVRLENVKQIGNRLAFAVPGLRAITNSTTEHVKYFGGGFHIDGQAWSGLLSQASGMPQIGVNARRVTGRAHWPNLAAKQAEVLRTIAGTWVSDGSGKEAPRTMTLQNNGSSVTGTVVYKASTATVEETVEGELIGERWLIVRGKSYRLLEGSVAGFNLDTWKLDLSWDGRRLHGTEGDSRRSFEPRMFIRR